jgi:hypothetical protein
MKKDFIDALNNGDRKGDRKRARCVKGNGKG